MTMTRTTVLAILAAAGIAAAGCHHTPPAAATAPTPPPARAAAAAPRTPPPPPPAAAAAPAPLSEAELFRRKSLDELNSEHPLGDAFFDYNQNTLRDDARTQLQQDASWLKKWPQTRIAVAGHCDERGSAEYNLGLGERRADAVRDYLTSLGVSSDRIETRSLGKESPFCRGEGEPCWSQNRRGHFLITAK
jgi:peptidoglycan-associated lipoprotein